MPNLGFIFAIIWCVGAIIMYRVTGDGIDTIKKQNPELVPDFVNWVCVFLILLWPISIIPIMARVIKHFRGEKRNEKKDGGQK